MAAGLFNFSYAVGCIVAPILGGYLNEIFKFRQTCDIMAIASLAYGVFYFFVRILGDKYFIPKHKPQPVKDNTSRTNSKNTDKYNS